MLCVSLSSAASKTSYQMNVKRGFLILTIIVISPLLILKLALRFDHHKPSPAPTLNSRDLRSHNQTTMELRFCDQQAPTSTCNAIYVEARLTADDQFHREWVSEHVASPDDCGSTRCPHLFSADLHEPGKQHKTLHPFGVWTVPGDTLVVTWTSTYHWDPQ